MQTSQRDLDQLGDEIAELSAHLDAATARLLDLIREFDARGGLPLVRRLAELACRARPRRRARACAGCARPGNAAAAGPCARLRRAVLRQGASADARCDA